MIKPISKVFYSLPFMGMGLFVGKYSAPGDRILTNYSLCTGYQQRICFLWSDPTPWAMNNGEPGYFKIEDAILYIGRLAITIPHFRNRIKNRQGDLSWT